MSTMTETGVTQVYRVYIKATPEAIWDAITKPEWNERYGYPGRGEYDLRPGGSYRAVAGAEAQAMGMPELLVEGEVIELDPAAQARPDVARGLGSRPRRRGLHPRHVGDLRARTAA